MATVFFSYAHADEDLRDQLEKHLSALKRSGMIDTWHDRQIVAGEPFDDKILAELEAADVVLALVSADFINSEYCFGREMALALERHSRGDCVLIPVILRACDWKATPLATLLAAPKDGRPIMQWPDRDEAYLDVVQSIRKALERLGTAACRPLQTMPSEIMPSTTRVQAGPRSSNLRIAKQFSERDRDRFVVDTYEYIAKYFENSISELTTRHSELESDFRRIDAERFTAVIYRSGKAVTKCSVFLSRSFGSLSIGYSNDDSGRTNSFNEQLSASSDDQALFFTTMSFTTKTNSKLSTPGAAEQLWTTFIERLQ